MSFRLHGLTWSPIPPAHATAPSLRARRFFGLSTMIERLEQGLDLPFPCRRCRSVPPGCRRSDRSPAPARPSPSRGAAGRRVVIIANATPAPAAAGGEENRVDRHIAIADHSLTAIRLLDWNSRYEGAPVFAAHIDTAPGAIALAAHPCGFHWKRSRANPCGRDALWAGDVLFLDMAQPVQPSSPGSMPSLVRALFREKERQHGRGRQVGNVINSALGAQKPNWILPATAAP